MLNEARARLANTKGKKAKRKAREKQLDDAKRLSSLQKRRELRAAGIDLKGRRKPKRKKGIDYLEEVPFEHRAPKGERAGGRVVTCSTLSGGARPLLGFFDTSDDRRRTRTLLEGRSFQKLNVAELEGERRDEKEDRARKKDMARQKLHKQTNLPAHVLLLNQLNDPEQQRRRSQMLLPAPQISDAEMEDIAKLGGVVGPSGIDVATTSGGKTLGSMPAPSRTPLTKGVARTPLQGRALGLRILRCVPS
jgi:pre-mRNA-splicing factor CDC5/CEF1